VSLSRKLFAVALCVAAFLFLGFATQPGQIVLSWKYQTDTNVVLNVWTRSEMSGPWVISFVLPSEARGLILDSGPGSRFFAVTASNVFTGEVSGKPGD
jgi:hypothetical protein